MAKRRGPEDGWFNELATFLGPAYLRNAFTKGTEQEVGFLVGELDLQPGMHVLDAGCGPGRHALALARRGMTVTGVDLSPDFIELARAVAQDEYLPATFAVMDVRDVPFGDRERVEGVVRDVMEHVTELRVPLVVDIGFGPTWADAK